VAAHLAGVISAHTILPVIGVPMASGDLKGLDALLSTVQMPGGIPVATVAIGSAGATNAALLAIEILALADPALRVKLYKHKTSMAEKVMKADAELQKLL
jgi:phosphoribosylaminoimidazole carboxylase PurE protein